MPIMLNTGKEVSAGVFKNLPFIKGMVAAGMKAKEIWRTYREVGLTGRDQYIYNAIDAMTRARSDKSLYLPADTRLKPIAEYIPQNPLKQLSSYSTVVGVTYFDRALGVAEVQYVTLNSNSLYTQQEYLDQAVELVENYLWEDQFVTESVDIDQINWSPYPVSGRL